MRRSKLPRVTCSLVSDELLFVTLALLLGCAPTAATTKGSGAVPVASASVAHEHKASPALKAFLNDRMKQELTALQLQGEASPPGYTADASVVTLARAGTGSRDKVSCTVLLMLLDSTHSPVATVRGNASAEGARDNPALARDAVRGAAHAAVSQLPRVFQQLRNQ